jgi:hypothetical protein
VRKEERNSLFNKARKYAKIFRRGMLPLSIITITGLIGFVKFPEKLFPQVPVSRTIPTSKQIPSFTPSPSFEQMPAAELIPAPEEVTASTPVPAFELITAFAPAPFFEPIPVIELLSAYEEVPVKILDTTNESELATTWWRLPEDRDQHQPGGGYRKMSRISRGHMSLISSSFSSFC